MKRLYLQPHTGEEPPVLVLHLKCRHCGHEEKEHHTYDIRAALDEMRLLTLWLYSNNAFGDNKPSKFGEVD